jgi:hypothetical protein
MATKQPYNSFDAFDSSRQVSDDGPIQTLAQLDKVAADSSRQVSDDGSIRTLAQLDKVAACALQDIFSGMSVIDINIEKPLFQYAHEFYGRMLSPGARWMYHWPTSDLEACLKSRDVPVAWHKDPYMPATVEIKNKVFRCILSSPIRRDRWSMYGTHAIPDDSARFSRTDNLLHTVQQDMAEPYSLDQLINVFQHALDHEDLLSLLSPNDRVNITAILYNLIRYEQIIPVIS